MSHFDQRTDQILARLNAVAELRPVDELAVYDSVLEDLTELLNAPDEYGPGE